MSRTIALTSAVLICVSLSVARAQGTQGTQTKPTTPPKTGTQTHPNTAMGNGSLKPADSKFLMDAAKVNMAEIDLAALADSKGTAPAVKQFSAKLKSDHEAAADDLKALAALKDVALPSSLSTTPKATKSRLDKLTGAAFDKAFADQMVLDHRHAVTAFTAASKSTDADVKSFAEKMLPTLKDHLQRALDLQKQLGGTGRGK